MDINRNGSQPPQRGPSEYFTGQRNQMTETAPCLM